MTKVCRVLAGVLSLSALSAVALAREGSVLLDRVVVRWSAPELGGAAHPIFIADRELSFWARIEALTDREARTAEPSDRHRRLALERAMAETLLLAEPNASMLSEVQVAKELQEARRRLELRVGGWDKLAAAARAEGITTDEVDALYQRRARVRLMLGLGSLALTEPTERELVEAQQSGTTPFTERPFAEARESLRRWVLEDGILRVLRARYQAARSRLNVLLIEPPAMRPVPVLPGG